MGDQLIELGLQQETVLLSVIDRILSAIPDAVGDSEKLQSGRFRDDIRHCREQLRSNERLEPVARRMLDLCRDYFKRARIYRVERELEYVELIEVLRGEISQLARDTISFSSQLLTSSERFAKITEIDDIRQIKDQITREVQELRRAVEDKQRLDEYNLSFLSRRVELLQSKLIRVQDEAAVDPLTRIANRGTFDSTLSRWIEEHSRTAQTFVLALTDIDDFKRINDTHGHRVGDRVLMGAAQSLAESIRPTDFVARYGGEEFAILLSGMKLVGAESRINQLIEKIAGCRFEYESGEIQFTVSCGLAEYALADTTDSLIQRADEALYEAKRKGKNRLVSRKKSLLKSMFGAK